MINFICGTSGQCSLTAVATVIAIGDQVVAYCGRFDGKKVQERPDGGFYIGSYGTLDILIWIYLSSFSVENPGEIYRDPTRWHPFNLS
jgi:hypothetical protein